MRHLDFFEHEAYLVARVPRVRCGEHGVRQVALPWARPGSGFTLLFEALVMALAAQMPIRAVAELVGEHDTRLWRIVHHHVDEALEQQDLSGVCRIGVDETSFKRGQDYVTMFADLDASRARGVRDARPRRRDLPAVRRRSQGSRWRGNPDQAGCQDMSEAFLSGALEHLPEAEITFDRYHVKAKLSKAVDEVRRAERREHHDLLKGTRYLWLRRPSTLSDRQRDWLDELLAQPLATAKAYELMLKFDAAYSLDRDEAEPYLRAWCRAARDSGLGPLADFAGMVEEYWLGIIEWFTSKGQQRAAGRPQQPHPGRQAPRAGVPLHAQLHRDDLSHRRQARCLGHPREIARPE